MLTTGTLLMCSMRCQDTHERGACLDERRKGRSSKDGAAPHCALPACVPQFCQWGVVNGAAPEHLDAIRLASGRACTMHLGCTMHLHFPPSLGAGTERYHAFLWAVSRPHQQTGCRCVPVSSSASFYAHTRMLRCPLPCSRAKERNASVSLNPAMHQGKPYSHQSVQPRGSMPAPRPVRTHGM
jgi:hypothetical protein